MWKLALESMANDIDTFGPTSFQDYLKIQGLKQPNTAALISIDSYEKLPTVLKQNDTMVLRLGSSPSGTGTQFFLVKVKDRLKDFFLFDDEVFTDPKGEYFNPTVSEAHLIGFRALPVPSETSLVNLALSTGLISMALGLDNQVIPSAPATGRSSFTFNVKPHTAIGEVFEHNHGQVEIDALFVAKRDGRDILFIIEAKCVDTHKSLAKHKLVYPVLAVAGNVPNYIPIVPVYMKVQRRAEELHYHIVECEYSDLRENIRSIDELTFKKHSHYILKLGE